jgi:two-component system C4-dicarboxylate transport sensor histidine kinase DctB
LDQAQLEELQHFAKLGRLSAHLLHEIANPLTAALLHLDQSTDRTSPEIRQARRSMQLLQRYVEAARQQIRQQDRPRSFALRPQFEQLKRVILPLVRQANVQLIIEPLPDCQLYGDPVKFQQILANLMVNAIDAYRHDTANNLGRPIRVRLTSDSRLLTIRVIDWGEGIAPSQLGQIFEPFYTTKTQPGRGLGIGLAIVRQYVVHDFGGSITVTSSRRQGTQFTIRLPLTSYRSASQ